MTHYIKDTYTWMTLVFFLLVQSTFAQSPVASHDVPLIGKPCPELIWKNVNRHPSTEITTASLKGKWTLLDFWTSWCGNCILSIPEINHIHETYKDQLNVFLVGKDDAPTHRVFDKLNTRHALTLPYVFDTVTQKKWGIESYPHYVILDPKGIVRAVTFKVTEKEIQDMLAGKALTFPVKPNRWELESQQRVQWDKPLLINGNGGEETDYLFRSILTRWNRTMGQVLNPYIIKRHIVDNRLQIVGTSALHLYQLAYQDTVSPDARYYYFDNEPTYGRHKKVPILEVKDTSFFHYDFLTGEGLYAYSLQVPADKKMSAHDFQLLMQRDLQNYFGYKVRNEQRRLPYWKLKVTNAKAAGALQTRGGEHVYESTQDVLTLRNAPMYNLINTLWYSDPDGPPCIDETGITTNIDLTLDAFVSDRASLRKALLKKGLFLEEGEKEMSVIVISDP